VLLTGALVAVVALVIFGGDENRDKKSVSPSCTANITFTVAPSTASAAAVQNVADAWNQTKPNAAGTCFFAKVTPGEPFTQEQGITAGSFGPDVWIPDSTIWVSRLNADLAGATTRLAVVAHPSVASSPLVAVANPTLAKTLAATFTGRFQDVWSQVLAGKLTVAATNPGTTSEGLLSLLSVQSLLKGTEAGSPLGMVATMSTLRQSLFPTIDAAFAKLAADPAKAPLFLASEQAVRNHNRAKGGEFAAAIYITEGAAALDFPFVVLRAPGPDDPAKAEAVTQFEAALRTHAAAAAFDAAGLRDTASAPLTDVKTGDGVAPTQAKTLTSITAAQAADMLRIWTIASLDAHTLAVMDLSGSMLDDAGNGQPRIKVASAALAAAVNFFPDSSDLGVWAFSSDQGRNSPWVELVPVGPLSQKLGSVTRRQKLVATAQSFPSRVHGATALYDTTLAAYRSAKAGYVPGKVNTIVLVTDGANDYPQGITLKQLTDQLRAFADPARPVPVIAIGIGNGVDSAALGKIASATGGKSYIVKDPADIRGVFLDAVLQRQCRPDC